LKSVGLGKSSKCFQHREHKYALQRIFLSRHISAKEYTSANASSSRNLE
jgi:hypothetical protein